MMIRLYYLLKDVMQAQKMVDKLLIKRVDISHMHFVADEGVNLKGLPEASLMQKSDIKHSLFMGLSSGALLGLLAGFLFHYALDMSPSALMIVSTILGAFIGGFSASLVGIRMLNYKFKQCETNLEQGEIMMMIDVPENRSEEIEQYIKKASPHAKLKGIDKKVWYLS